MKDKKVSLLDLFGVFAKIGGLTVGGGLAMVAVIERELVTKRKWITDEELLDMIAVAESTPGVIAVNSATFVGYKLRGFLGALVSTIGVVLPSFVLISLIALVFEWFLGFEIIQFAFKGANAAVAVLILNAALKLFKKCEKSAYTYIALALAIVLGLIFMIFSISTVIIIIIGLIIGVVYYTILDNKAKKLAKKEEVSKEEGEE